LAAWLLGCLAAWLLGCLAAWLLGCLAAWLLGCLALLMLTQNNYEKQNDPSNIFSILSFMRSDRYKMTGLLKN
jgi:hypothetical protein